MKKNIVILLLLAALSQVCKAETYQQFGHKIEITEQSGEERKLIVDGKLLEHDYSILIDETAIVGGWGVIIFSKSGGGNACDGDKFVVSFPQGKPLHVDGPIGDCLTIDYKIHDGDIVFSTTPSPSNEGHRWTWNPVTGFARVENIAFRPQAGKTWDDLRSRDIHHPSELFNYSDIGSQLKSLLGSDYGDALPTIEGPGSGEFKGDYFIGTAIMAHMGGETGSLVIADIRARTLYVAWKAVDKKIAIRPDIAKWPERLRFYLKEWAKPWYNHR
jgi:hypothetical protein